MRPWFVLALALLAGPALADPAEGDWLTPQGAAKVRLATCANTPGRLCGRITWLKDGLDAQGVAKRDIRNPDPTLRSRTIVGMPFLRDFRPASAGRWVGGKIYDPDSGKTYDSKLAVTRDGSLKLEGCVLVICQAQTWTRAAAAEAGR